jgi:hypothetical protein
MPTTTVTIYGAVWDEVSINTAARDPRTGLIPEDGAYEIQHYHGRDTRGFWFGSGEVFSATEVGL